MSENTKESWGENSEYLQDFPCGIDICEDHLEIKQPFHHVCIASSSSNMKDVGTSGVRASLSGILDQRRKGSTSP